MLVKLGYILLGQPKEYFQAYKERLLYGIKILPLRFKKVIIGFKVLREKNNLLKSLFLSTLLLMPKNYYKTLKDNDGPFFYYRTIGGYLLRNFIVWLILGLMIKLYINNFQDMKIYLYNIFPHEEYMGYMEGYAPYSVCLVFVTGWLVQLGMIFLSKKVRELFVTYKYIILMFNLTVLGWIYLRYCSLTIVGVLEVWWIPESVNKLDGLIRPEQFELVDMISEWYRDWLECKKWFLILVRGVIAEW